MLVAKSLSIKALMACQREINPELEAGEKNHFWTDTFLFEKLQETSPLLLTIWSEFSLFWVDVHFERMRS